MKCPECKVDNAADHNYCKHCGFPLRTHALERELRVGSAARARDRCLLILKHNADSPEAHFNLGMAYYHLGDLDDAVRAFQRAIELDETLGYAHFQLAVCRYRGGRFAECADHCRMALRYNPDSVPTLYRLARSLFHLGQLDEALEIFGRVIEADPSYVIAYYHVGVIHERLGAVD